MSESEDRETVPAAMRSSLQDQAARQQPSDSTDSSTARSRVPDTIGVYDRPAGLKRYPAWLIAVVTLIVLASVAYFLFTFVF